MVGLRTSEQTPAHLKWQRTLLSACIILAPASISLYLVSWSGNVRDPISASAMAGSTGNVLHLIGGVAASFFLPLGYLGMSLLAMRRAPGRASVAAALSLVGWIPWSALMGLDDLAYDINAAGGGADLAVLWWRFNGDAVMTTYLLIYVVCHLAGAVLIGFMLGRLRIIPLWAAWSFALTSPLTIIYFPVPSLATKNVLKYVICVLWIAGAIPAALRC
jgi:hypothetical protein